MHGLSRHVFCHSRPPPISVLSQFGEMCAKVRWHTHLEDTEADKWLLSKVADNVAGHSLDAAEQAQRVQDFMNYQVIHVMGEFDEELDQLLFYLPLAGSAFKKVYYDETLGRAVSKFIAPEDLIVPYYTTDLETCPRITNVIKMPENEVKKLQMSGFYMDIDLTGSDDDESSEVKEEIEKTYLVIRDVCSLLN